MTTTPTSTETKLLCPECRRENESERVYCHDCGTRLDRSAVRIKKEPIDDTRKRVKRMFDPQRAKIRAAFFATNKLLLRAAALAILVDMILPPDVPAPAKNQILVSTLRFDLEDMATKRKPLRKEISEEEANAFVASALRSKQSSLDKPFLPFKRVLVALRPHRLDVTAERSLDGYWSVYTTCLYSPELKDGRLSAKIEGGHIGRLPIHPKLARFMGVLFSDVWSALDRDAKLIMKLGAIELNEKSATLTASAP